MFGHEPFTGTDWCLVHATARRIHNAQHLFNGSILLILGIDHTVIKFSQPS